MCGIAGVLYRDPTRLPEEKVLSAMAGALAHRGPDDEGILLAPGIGMVHRRLSIIDLAGGHQPMFNEDRSAAIVFNGEIYNFRALRPALEAKGHHFRTQSDTEVLIHLYEEVDEQLLDRVRGMFAFALWDASTRRLLLARDRVGLKPLYVYRDDEKLLFASELKGVLAHPDVDQAIDPCAIEDFITFGMVPGSRSVYRRASKLPAGHVLSVTSETLTEATPRRYWQLRPNPDEHRTADQWQSAVSEKVFETVDAHRIADVPVGAFLSGGLDSSIMVAVQSEISARPVRTFSIGFEEAKFSELPFAREVAKRFRASHHEQIVMAEGIGVLDEMVRFYDEPFADSSAVPTLYVSRLARESVKVVLSGDGGDEAFGGYTRYVHDMREAALRRRIPEAIRSGLLGRLGDVWPKADWLPRWLRFKTALTNLSMDPAHAYANTLSLARPELRREILSPELLAQTADHRPEQYILDAYRNAQTDDPLAAMIATDIATILPDDFLTKVDRASMSCGLEVRPPLVDHELLELAATIPSCYKVRGGHTKWLLKETYQKLLPSEIPWRRKQGFEIPVDDWLRGPLGEVFELAVLGPTSPIRQWINPPGVERMLQRHRSQMGRHGSVLWSLLVLARWAATYTDG